MGLMISKERFEQSDHVRFQAKLKECLSALEQVLGQPGFGEGDASLGAELEVFLVGDRAEPLTLSSEILEATRDTRVALELGRFNLECNTNPSLLAGAPFAALRGELQGVLESLRKAAAPRGAGIALVGILPTLKREELMLAAISDVARYRALNRALTERRHGQFQFNIDGEDPLRTEWESVAPEGANTSLQLHLRVEPQRFSRMYNAVQLATAPALAVSGNSPTFLGHRLWQETRIALFKQAVDERMKTARGNPGQARVGFGSKWIQHGALELFRDTVQQHEVLVPMVYSSSPQEVLEAGKYPELRELRLHASTVWMWNRAVYDPTGHLRIEMRALPTGPTVTDMLANSAFLLGLSYAFEETNLAPQLPFELAHANFYRAAQLGLDAVFDWPAEEGIVRIPARELLPTLSPLAIRGLAIAGVDRPDSSELLQIFSHRVASGATGAQWQLKRLAQLRKNRDVAPALERMTLEYMRRSESDTPVHCWPI